MGRPNSPLFSTTSAPRTLEYVTLSRGLVENDSAAATEEDVDGIAAAVFEAPISELIDAEYEEILEEDGLLARGEAAIAAVTPVPARELE